MTYSPRASTALQALPGMTIVHFLMGIYYTLALVKLTLRLSAYAQTGGAPPRQANG